jgi:phage repressor protein C with HTH and peptisase S24 domain
MLSHKRVWAAIDELAASQGLTASGLAKLAGLDPTTFNRSKRTSSAGRDRWPSTESLAKVLEATGVTTDEFVALMKGQRSAKRPRKAVPVIGFAQAGDGGFFDDSGFPVGHGWERIEFPGAFGESAFALKISGDSMLPLFRHGDTIIVDRTAACRRGDRVVVKTRTGEVMAKVLQKKTIRIVGLASLNPAHPDRSFSAAEVEWIGRIVWASQ